MIIYYSYQLIDIKFNIMRNKGFTLIELLVVIAIIGILSSVVLASLNTARDKGEDAAVKSNINNARAQAELFYDGNSNSYDTVCTSASSTSLVAITNALDDLGVTNTCDDGTDNWALEGQMSDGSFYCADSTGISTTTAATSNIGADAAAVCDGA